MSAAHVAMAHGAGGSWRMDNASPAGPCLVRLLSATRAATCARLTSFASAFDLDSKLDPGRALGRFVSQSRHDQLRDDA